MTEQELREKMKQKQPTQEQIKEFWEWCGWKPCRIHAPMSPEKDGWENPLPITSFDKYLARLPDLDLNNLFKYAVPLAIDKIMSKQGCSSDLAYAVLFKKWLQKLELDIPNHEGTLFWVIWEIIKK